MDLLNIRSVAVVAIGLPSRRARADYLEVMETAK
jgi:hypothetical protein